MLETIIEYSGDRYVVTSRYLNGEPYTSKSDNSTLLYHRWDGTPWMILYPSGKFWLELFGGHRDTDGRLQLQGNFQVEDDHLTLNALESSRFRGSSIRTFNLQGNQSTIYANDGVFKGTCSLRIPKQNSSFDRPIFDFQLKQAILTDELGNISHHFVNL